MRATAFPFEYFAHHHLGNSTLQFLSKLGVTGRYQLLKERHYFDRRQANLIPSVQIQSMFLTAAIGTAIFVRAHTYLYLTVIFF